MGLDRRSIRFCAIHWYGSINNEFIQSSSKSSLQRHTAAHDALVCMPLYVLKESYFYRLKRNLRMIVDVCVLIIKLSAGARKVFFLKRYVPLCFVVSETICFFLLYFCLEMFFLFIVLYQKGCFLLYSRLRNTMFLSIILSRYYFGFSGWRGNNKFQRGEGRG
jgi:hypothetical protein